MSEGREARGERISDAKSPSWAHRSRSNVGLHHGKCHVYLRSQVLMGAPTSRPVMKDASSDGGLFALPVLQEPGNQQL